MIDGASKLGRGIASCAVCAAAACGVAMNIKFWHSFAADDVDKILMPAFSAAVDIVKIFALSAAMAAFSKGYKLKGTLMSVIFGGAVVFGLCSAFGFVASSRDGYARERIEAARPVKDAILEARANGRRFQTLTDKLESVKQDKVWLNTAGCLDATARSSKTFCSLYWQDMNELKDLTSVSKIMSDKEMEDQLALAETVDPQIALIARLTGADPNAILFRLTVFVAIMMELVSAGGIYGFSRSIRKPEVRSAPASSRPKLRAVT